MSMDAIKQVADSEAQAQAQVREAQAQAKALVEQAEKDGQARLDQARKEARTKAGELLTRAEETGAEKTREILAQYETDCQALKAAAETKLDETARLIVGKVVGG